MKSHRMKDELENIARRSVPEDINLWPNISARLERKSQMLTPRTRPVMAMLIALLTLLMLSGVVYALGKALGYIPGVGIINQDAPVRALAEPVTVVRDGVTFTIADAILSSDKTVILYSIENVPFEAVSHNEGIFGCMPKVELRLPNGKTLATDAVAGYEARPANAGLGYKARLIFEPIPSNVNDAVLYMDCILYTLPGLAPENWEINLQFIPAPPERINSLPVIEYTSAPTSVTALIPSAENATQLPQQPNPISISKVIDAGDSYILMGEFRSPTPENSSEHILKLLDTTGLEIPWDTPQDIDPDFIPGADVWLVKIEKSQAFPIRVEYSELVTHLDPSKMDSYEFEFDAGADSYIGQHWDINREISLAGYDFTLASISAQQGGGCAECLSMVEYTFHFTSSDTVRDVTLMAPELRELAPFNATPLLSMRLPDGGLNIIAVEFEGYKSNGGHMGVIQPTEWEIGNTQPNLLRGNVKVRITNLPGSSEVKNWSLDWQPEGYAPSTTSAPRPCLTLDSWSAALANPAPLPAGLSGKVATSPSNKDLAPLGHVYISNLDGSEKQIINDAWDASLSPDGRQVIFQVILDQGSELRLLDLLTGEERRLPFTMGGGRDPFWSPDGRNIAISHPDGLYVFNADGTNVRKPSGVSYPGLLGWSPDSNSILLIDGAKGGGIKEINLETGQEQNLLVNQGYIYWASVSPRTGNIAFLRSYVGNGMQVLYIASADGSNPVQLARMGYWGLKPWGWSADGKWLLLGLINTDNPYDMKMENALVNPQTCEIVPLAIQGEIQSWVP